MIDRLNPRCDLEVDGGIDPETAQIGGRGGSQCSGGGIGSFWKSRRSAAEMASLRAGLSSSVYNIR